MKEQNCSHPGCGCPIEPGKEIKQKGISYCSEYCARQGVAISANCQCGHTECHKDE